jgi:hypothetical protein
MRRGRRFYFEDFIGKWQPVVDDPDTGEHTLVRIIVESSALYCDLAKMAGEVGTQAEAAARRVEDALAAPYPSLREVHARERVWIP